MFRCLIPFFLIPILFPSVKSDSPEPSGNWFGILKIESFNYRIFLSYTKESSRVCILNPKSNQIPLDTIFFRNDSLYFNRTDFFSTFEGLHHPQSNTIKGVWTTDDHKKYNVVFKPVNPDTLTGLRPRTSAVYAWEKPAQQSDGLKTGYLEEHQINKTLVDSLTHHIMKEKYPNIHSILIARNNTLVYEEYFYGWMPKDLWLIQSVTKSFVGALTGIAISKGELNVNDPICQYLPEYKEKACNDQNKNITIHHLLNMSTGLDWNELEFDYYDERNTANQCGRTRDAFDCVLSRPKVNSAVPVFAYNSMNHSLMNKILRKATGMKNPKELNQRLLMPLNIQQVKTGNQYKGVIGDISLTTRDMLKFGIVYLNDGKWQGKQIIPSVWVKESTSTKIKIGEGEGYGYFWWTKKFNVNGKPMDCFYAWGYAGQYIIVVPEQKIVVAMTASNWGMDEKKYAFSMMENFILPACED